jgi:hypothetical protein
MRVPGARSVRRAGATRTVNRAPRPKRMKCECEGRFVRNVDKSTVNLPLHDNASNVAAGRYRTAIKRTSLPEFLCERQVAILDFVLLPQQRKRPRSSRRA